MYFHVVPHFSHEFLAKTCLKTFRQLPWSFWTSLDLPRPLPTHFTSVLHFWCFFEKSVFFFKYVLCISYIFFIFWAPEALGPVPNCRSHFSASNRGIESFWNLHGTSFVTKQCSKCIANKYAKFRYQKKWWLYLWNSPGGGKELLKFSQSTILLSLNTTYTRIPFLRPVNQMY